jgi:adenylate kinase family enzyme
MTLNFRLKNMKNKKIAVIGCSGSGKTYLTLKLAKKLQLPIYHLDQYAWKPNWQRVDIEALKKIHHELCKKDAWIMEGIYFRLLHERVQAADIIIFLDMSRSVCLWNVIKRSWFNSAKVIEGNPQACVQNIFSFKFLEFLQWIWNFDLKHRSDILHTLQEFEQSKQVYVIQSRQEMNALIEDC